MKNKLPDFYNEDPEQLVIKKELRLSLNEEIAFLTRRRDELKKEIEELKEKAEEVRLDYTKDDTQFIPVPFMPSIGSSSSSGTFSFGGGQSGGGGSSNSW